MSEQLQQVETTYNQKLLDQKAEYENQLRRIHTDLVSVTMDLNFNIDYQNKHRLECITGLVVNGGQHLYIHKFSRSSSHLLFTSMKLHVQWSTVTCV